LEKGRPAHGRAFDRPLQSSGTKSTIGAGAPIGSGKRNQASIGGDPVLPGNSGGLWASGVSVGPGPGFGSSTNVGPGGDSIMGTTIGTIGGATSTALASMLGINLPTRSGSLRELSSLWGTPAEQAPISSLNGNSFPMQGVIGSGPSNPNNGLIGGVTIGGGQAPMGSGTIGGGGNKSDITLLQSLLPCTLGFKSPVVVPTTMATALVLLVEAAAETIGIILVETNLNKMPPEVTWAIENHASSNGTGDCSRHLVVLLLELLAKRRGSRASNKPQEMSGRPYLVDD
jgi:hypothetical protein